ncbi:hypothetical protein KIN20_030705 [Parelaphostrongylus tenuis]|uniref:Uncharacterized protein n=1 Tax=Parelaphostrongylus tenuis TaxID=148309 RepID=A0AAD5R4G9_PARTN|nr:hypothetical protein KIN20_030705 [Parelaphostrongylus tenuis]
MARLMTNPIMISLLVTISAALGCGVMPAGQSRSRPFSVSGFSLPVAMVYSGKTEVLSQVPGIASDKGGAQAFVQRLIMQTVVDVLENQGRSALLPDVVISGILSQLSVNITYEPMECPAVAITRMEMVNLMAGKTPSRCIIVGDTVTGICTALMMADAMCTTPSPMVAITSVPANYTTISGVLTTTNIIMTNWSRTMWQEILNRAIRMLALGPLKSHFFSAAGTVGGN